MQIPYLQLCLIVVVNVLIIVQSEELLELNCINETQCKQFQRSGITADCINERCQCTDASGEHVKCKPMDRKLNNIIGGSCPCSQPNSECDEEQDTCYCARDFMPSSDKRRCIKNVALPDESCEMDLQCQRGDPNALCHAAYQQCKCMDLFLIANDTCTSIVGNSIICSNDTICVDKFGTNSVCFNDLYYCVCLPGYIASIDNSSCLEIPKYLGNCTENLQCISSMGPGGVCADNRCQCNEKFYVEEKRSKDGNLQAVCSPFIERGQYCRYPEDCYQRQLNESEQSMACVYGECDCRFGFNSYNDGACVRGSGGFRSTLSSVAIFVVIVVNVYYMLYLTV